MVDRDTVASIRESLEGFREALDLVAVAAERMETLERRASKANDLVAKTANVLQAAVFAIDAVDRCGSGTSSVRRGEALADLRKVKARMLALGIDLVAFARGT